MDKTRPNIKDFSHTPLLDTNGPINQDATDATVGRSPPAVAVVNPIKETPSIFFSFNNTRAPLEQAVTSQTIRFADYSLVGSPTTVEFAAQAVESNFIENNLYSSSTNVPISTALQQTKNTQIKFGQSAADVAIKKSLASKKLKSAKRLSKKARAKAKRTLNDLPPTPLETIALLPIKTTSTAAFHTVFSQLAETRLCVAVTCEHTGFLTQDIADKVLNSIHNKIIEEAWSISSPNTVSPMFNGKPLYTEGVIKLYCGDDYTLGWLQNTVAGLALPSSISLVVKNQAEVPARVSCGILFPKDQGVWEDVKDIGRVLAFQNPWVDITKWMLYSAEKQATGWFVKVKLPEDQIPTIMKADRRLACGCGIVYLKFQGADGKYTDMPQACLTTPSMHCDMTTKSAESTEHVLSEDAIAAIKRIFARTFMPQPMIPLNSADHIKVIQINLQHRHQAAVRLRKWLEGQHTAIALIQKPWIKGGLVQGLFNLKGKRFYATNHDAPRSCIFFTKNISAEPLQQFISQDVSAIKLKIQQDMVVVFASVFMPEANKPPPSDLIKLVEYCKKEGCEIIIGADSNAHHPLWGMIKQNKRGKILVKYINTENLTVLNKGSTFATRRFHSIVDLTLATEKVSKFTLDWHVSDEPTCSDHKWILFDLEVLSGSKQQYQNQRLPLGEHEFNILETEQEDHQALTAQKTTSLDTQPWWDKDLEFFKNYVGHAFNYAMNTKTKADMENYKAVKAEYKKLIRSKRTMDMSKIHKINESSGQKKE